VFPLLVIAAGIETAEAQMLRAGASDIARNMI